MIILFCVLYILIIFISYFCSIRFGFVSKDDLKDELIIFACIFWPFSLMFQLGFCLFKILGFLFDLCGAWAYSGSKAGKSDLVEEVLDK